VTRQPEYIIEINDWTPDVLEYRPVPDLDWKSIQFPDDAYMFVFYDRSQGQPHPPISDWFYLSTDPRLLTPEEAAREFPEYADDVALWASRGAEIFANHAYEYGGHRGTRIVPMIPGIVFIDRTSMRQIWPTAA
jgi:hypothetical protein